MKTFLRTIICICFLMTATATIAQTVTDPSLQDPEYDARKLRGASAKVAGNTSKAPAQASAAANAALNGVSCMIPRDASYIPVERNDDGSYGPIALPFSYNLYGTSYTEVWINTNGNLTFTGPYGVYNPSGFPISVPMVAGFWTDVDTRNTAGGQIYYKVFPTRLVVTWDSVGYFSNSVDKLNTFQIIITNGNDPVVGPGLNTAFYYGDMQWTTGSAAASGGVGGFGGTPATVGVNRGTNNNYVQIGRFNANTSAYDGPSGSFDGVNYLDNQCFSFNVTNTQNIAPSVSGLPAGHTITIDAGDTVRLSPSFTGPEVGQTVTTTVNTQGVCRTDHTVTNGAVSTVNFRFIGDACNVGTNVITFSATDNGSPAQTTNVSFTIIVNKVNQTITFPPPAEIPGGGALPLTATASSGLPVTYTVLSGPASVSGSTLSLLGVGLVTVRASQLGNDAYNAAVPVDIVLCIAPSQPGSIAGKTDVCVNSQQTYNVTNIAGASFSWSVDGGGTVTSFGSTASVRWNTLGTHTLSVRYTTNCGTVGPARTITVQVLNQTLSGSFTRLLPADGAADLLLPLHFLWFPITNANAYDIYIWPENAMRPATPTIAGITAVEYTLYSSSTLVYDRPNNWQVVAKSGCDELAGPVQTFRLRPLPDLVVDSITIPATANSEAAITIAWRIKNQGMGPAGATPWKEYVYLSDAPKLGIATDHFIGSYNNLSALQPGETYQSPAVSYRIPQGLQGLHYIIVTTDPYSAIKETVDTNNTRVRSLTINLSPPPDLQVTNLVTSRTTLFSEDSITVNWTVKNMGTGPTTINPDWYDAVYLSQDNVLNTSNARLMGEFRHTGALQVNGEYASSRSFKMPAYIGGTWYVHVVTDRSNRIFEYIDENNNTAASLPLEVFMRPAPDLTIVAAETVTDTVSAGQSIPIDWILKNEGAAAARPLWTDEITLGRETTYNPATSLAFFTYMQRDTLQAQAAKSNQVSFRLPATLPEGKYYAFARADRSEVIFEAGMESNNVSPYAGPIIVVRPDIAPISLEHPLTAQSGESIAVSWKGRNNGRGNLLQSTWIDAVFLSTDTVFSSGDVFLGTVPNTALLPVDGQYSRQQPVTLPQGIAGTYYLFVVTDQGNLIAENNETNNRLRSPITISLAPWPDLQVTDIQTPATDTVATAMNLAYTVKNSGTAGIVNKSWIDRIYLSTSNQINTNNLLFLKDLTQQQTLDTGGVYNITTTIPIPASLSAGEYYVHIITDANSQLFEHTTENNNRSVSAPISIRPLPSIDLAVDTAILSLDSVTAGEVIQARWVVRNASLNPTFINSWEDVIYLSNDSVADAGDLLLGSWTINASLQPGARYTQTKNIRIPNGADGTFYILVVADRSNQQRDTIRSNNALRLALKSSVGGGGSGGGGQSGPEPIIITQPPSPDLIPLQVTLPEDAYALQPVTISYTIKNDGPGITRDSVWEEKVYLSRDLTLSGDDIVIGTFSRTGALLSGAQYQDSKQVFLPDSASGYYVVILKTDAGDKVYEGGSENNNLAFANIFIQPQSPSDLMVNTIDVPQNIKIAGDTCTIQWRIANSGNNVAVGYMKEAVYLSMDSTWDASDVLLGTSEDYIGLAPQESASRKLTGRLLHVGAGHYYVIVRTDLLNTIVESNDTNNIVTAAAMLTVDVKELRLNNLTADTLITNEPLYYRLEVPASLQGQALSVKLDGDTVNNIANRLFISHGNVPAPNDYDLAAQVPFSARQQAIIPALDSGTYYITVYGNKPSGTQAITLLAAIIPFRITSADANKGGNTGIVTVKIEGARFEQHTAFRLHKDSTLIQPAAIHFINSSLVFVSYNLQQAPTGSYTVIATKLSGDTAQLTNGFEVIAGPGSSIGGGGGSGSGGPGGGAGFVCQITNIGFEELLRTEALHPESTRPQRVVAITIYYENKGTVDVPVPIRYLVSQAGAPLGFTPEELEKNLQELILEFKEPGGPAGILRPGANGYIKVFTKAVAPLQFVIVE